MALAEWRRFKEALTEYARQSTFEARMSRLETICREIPGVLPNRPLDAPPEPQTQAWYAEAILFGINAARHQVAKGDAAYAAVEALSIGALATEAARLDWSDIRGWLELVDSEAKDRALIARVMLTVAFAGQICREYPEKNYGLDMEIEFHDQSRRPSGRKVYLQLKSGDSHLRPRKSDGREIFRIRRRDHAEYWMKQVFPVFVVLANSRGEARWMEVRDHLRDLTRLTGEIPKSIAFSGERFTKESVLAWRGKLLNAEI